MSTEQPNEDGKIDVQINFHRLPFALRCSLSKFRTPCIKSECSENCVMLEIRNAMDESL